MPTAIGSIGWIPDLAAMLSDDEVAPIPDIRPERHARDTGERNPMAQVQNS
jgi:hypothetical protein